MKAWILPPGASRALPTTDAAEVRRAYDEGARLWLDLIDRQPEVDALLVELFHLHPLVIEDLWQDRSAAKIDAFEDYLYIVAYGVRRGSVPRTIDLSIVDLVVGERFVITHHTGSVTIQLIRDDEARAAALLSKGPMWIAHAVIDGIVDRFAPLIAEFGREMEALEHDVVLKAGTPQARDQLPTIFALKRSAQILLRITSHQQPMLLSLARGDYALLPRETIPFFRDVSDHFAHVADHVTEYRDLVVNTLDAYLSVRSDRMSETMKTLTLISTVMLPLNFIAAVYGMNFSFVPEERWRYGHYFALLLMVVVAVAIIFWFRRRRLL